jgi:uncharacterized membrane protein YozB (DUF420 family)
MATATATTQGALPKFQLRPKYLGFAFVGVMMAYVLVHNESYLWNSHDPIWAHYRTIKWYLLPHGLAAACALLLGPMQFSDRLRARFAKFHRVIGRFYVAGALIGGPMGAVMQAVEGPAEWTTLSVVDAVMWAGTTFIALLFILKGNVTQHRNWMIRSYTIAIVFLGGRFFGGLTKMDQPGHEAMLLAIITACLALSVPIADVGIHLQDLKRKRVAARAVAA